MLYAVLADDLNHTCIHLVKAETKESALKRFLSDEYAEEQDDKAANLLAKETNIRFEIHEVCISDTHNKQQLLCSRDQINDIDESDLFHYLAMRHLQLGLTYIGHQLFNEAVIQLNEARKLLPNNASVCRILGDAHTRAGDLVTAIGVYKDCLNIAKVDTVEYDSCLLSLAEIYRSVGDHTSAVNSFRKYLALQEADDSTTLEDQYETDIREYIDQYTEEHFI